MPSNYQPPNFSLAPSHITPIRPYKVDRLFSPCSTASSVKNTANLTYRVPSPAKYQAALGDGIDFKYPLHSTSLKHRGMPLSVELAQSMAAPPSVPPPLPSCQFEVVNDSIEQVSTICSESEISTVQNSTIAQYQPVYHIKDRTPIRATCFHPTGDFFVVGSNSHEMSLCRYPSQDELRDFNNVLPEFAFKFFQIHEGSVYCARFNDKGNLLATGSNDQSVHVVKINYEKQMPEGNEYRLVMHSGTVRDVCFIGNLDSKSDSDLLLSAGAGDFNIYLSDCSVMRPINQLEGHKAAVMSLHAWGDVHHFVSGAMDGTVKLWDIRTKQCSSTFGTFSAGGDANSTSSSGIPVGCVRVDPTGRMLVSGHSDGRCMFYDIRAGKVVQLFKAHEDEIRSVNFSPKSYYLLTASYDHKIKLMDLQGDLSMRLPSVDIAKADNKLVQTAWHPEDYTFVSTCADGTATLWAVPEAESYEQDEKQSEGDAFGITKTIL